jgi:hypothetical protein
VPEQAAQPPENRSFIPMPSGFNLKPHQLALVGMIFGLAGLATILFFNVLQAIGFAIVIGVLAYSYISIRNERDSVDFQPAHPLLQAGEYVPFDPTSTGTPSDATSQGDGSIVPEFAKSTSNTHDFSPFPRPNHTEFNAKAIASMEPGGAAQGVAPSAAPGGVQSGASGAIQNAAPGAVPGGFQSEALGAVQSAALGSAPGGFQSGAFGAVHSALPGAVQHALDAAQSAIPSGIHSGAYGTVQGGAPVAPQFLSPHPGVADLRSANAFPGIGVTPTNTVAASQANSFAADPQMTVPADQVITVSPTQTTSSNPFMRRAHYCWKCKDLMYVYSWPGHHMWSTDMPPQPRPESVQFRFYQTIGAKYWANVCQKCDSVQGDHLVFDEHSPYKWENFSQ